MQIQKDTFANDSTKNQLGFEYQKLIALEHCLNAKRGEFVYIECFGDVLAGNISMEIKHHEGHHNMTSNSTDAWKTLKNYVEEFDKIIANDKLILFTTSTIKSDSIFFNWNNQSATQKYLSLKKHLPGETCALFKSVIFDPEKISGVNLKKILAKFTIQSEQPNISTKLEELKNHTYFNLIDNKLKVNAISVANGYIIHKAIDNSNKWEINITDFIDDLKIPLSQFTKDYIQFTVSSIDPDDLRLNDRSYKFVKKLREIGIKETDQLAAVRNYLRSEKSHQELLLLNPLLLKSLERYDENVEEDIIAEKSQISYTVSSEDFQNDGHLTKSRYVYFNCLNRAYPNITGVRDTEKYYRDGRIQNIADISSFEWLFNDKEI